MTITSSLRFLYIFRGPGLLCGSIGWDWTGWKWIAKDRKNRTNYLYCNQNDCKKVRTIHGCYGKTIIVPGSSIVLALLPYFNHIFVLLVTGRRWGQWWRGSSRSGIKIRSAATSIMKYQIRIIDIFSSDVYEWSTRMYEFIDQRGVSCTCHRSSTVSS